MAIKFKIEGMKELERSIKKLGQVPQKHITSSARKGMNVSLKDSRANAPYDTGQQKKGAPFRAERREIPQRQKSFWFIGREVFDDKMNIGGKTCPKGKPRQQGRR